MEQHNNTHDSTILQIVSFKLNKEKFGAEVKGKGINRMLELNEVLNSQDFVDIVVNFLIRIIIVLVLIVLLNSNIHKYPAKKFL